VTKRYLVLALNIMDCIKGTTEIISSWPLKSRHHVSCKVAAKFLA